MLTGVSASSSVASLLRALSEKLFCFCSTASFENGFICRACHKLLYVKKYKVLDKTEQMFYYLNEQVLERVHAMEGGGECVYTEAEKTLVKEEPWKQKIESNWK